VEKENKYPITISFVHHCEIDKQQWDAALLKCSNARVYASSWYLDAMCPGWCALISNDHQYIMPLPVRKKYGIEYIYHPAFVQQLGIFSSAPITEKIITAFIHHVPSTYRWINYPLNSKNLLSPLSISFRQNYLLRLTDHASLKKRYNRNASRNILKAINAGIHIAEHINYVNIIAIHRSRFNLKEKEYGALATVLENAKQHNGLYTVGAFENDVLVAASVYLLYKNRLIFILNGNTKRGLENGASFLLKDHVIKTFCGTKMIMDFEGSDNRRFSNFYRHFGAHRIEHYPVLNLNRTCIPSGIINTVRQLRDRSVL
jgi:hypothetical protein